MNNQIDDLKKMWQDSRSSDFGKSTDCEKIIGMAKQKMKHTVRMQLATILILTITLAIISLYIMYVANFQQIMSHVGMFLMIGGIALRIIIELYSISLSKRIDLGKSVSETNQTSFIYHKFRKVINGPVTSAILIAYSIGFYLLTPEFSRYFSLPVMILLDLSYVVIAWVFIHIIRKAIKKEMNILDEILLIQNDIDENV